MNRKSAVILLSRQHLHPDSSTPWVKATRAAVEWVKENNLALLTSTGMQTWEVVLFLATQMSIPVTVVIPCNKRDFDDRCKFFQNQFCMASDSVKWIMVSDGENGNCKDSVSSRDRYLIETADILLPVSIRKNGVMNELLMSTKNKTVITSFGIPYNSTATVKKIDYSQCIVNSEIETASDDYLFHWTRASSSKWPDETLWSFYADVLSSITYPRNVLSTLEHIISRRLLIASTRHMAKDCRCVSFTSKKPVAFVSHMRWRSRYTEMSFEPYGIGIRSDSARNAGIHEVQYVTDNNKSQISNVAPWLRQSAGKAGDWQREQEYRHNGDFEFSTIRNDDLIVICKSPKEADYLQSKYKIRTIPLFL